MRNGTIDSRAWVMTSLVALVNGASLAATNLAPPPSKWIDRFSFTPPSVAAEELGAPSSEPLPTFVVTPAAAGRQLVRVSLPFAPGTFPDQIGLVVRSGAKEIMPAVRPLTFHPGRPQSIRRAILSFIYDFSGTSAVHFRTALHALPREQPQGSLRSGSEPAESSDRFEGRIGSLDLMLTAGALQITRPGEPPIRAEFIAPQLPTASTTAVECVERNQHYLWVRLFVADARWPRIFELRADATGTLAVRAHLQRFEPAADQRPRAPDIGWRITGLAPKAIRVGESRTTIVAPAVKHRFDTGGATSVEAGALTLDFPDAHLHRRGQLSVRRGGEASEVKYLRCEASEEVPHQLAAWRTATFVLRPSSVAPWTSLLEPSHQVQIPASAFASVYSSGTTPDLSAWPLLAGVTQFHRDAIASCLLPGDDYGNVTSMPTGGVFGMNRLNHGPGIFEEYYRSGDARLRNVGLAWCVNMHDLSLWWGNNKPDQFGGTRYNNMAAQDKDFVDDKRFMWRSDSAVDFCTKGLDAFFYAYEETGDPEMSCALRWQLDYALQHIHLKTEMRDIGDVADLLRLYRFTGRTDCREQALRYFRELRTHLSPGDLFSQNGQQIESDVPYIADDAVGMKHPYAKPYIIGYALAGLPELARYEPSEPKLVDVIRAVAHFLADAQDPVGGWSYPHPRSPGVMLSQAIEHTMQITNAAEYLESRGEPIGPLLDAIERTLQARILVWQRTGTFFSGLGSWEQAAGLIKDPQDWSVRYQRPGDRDRARDSTQGGIGLGSAPPEGVVYFFRVLSFYLDHRPAERLFHANTRLQEVLNRIAATTQSLASEQASGDYLRYGVAAFLPTFSDDVVGRLSFPLRYDPKRWPSFPEWRREARQTLLRTLLTPPPRADFNAVVIAKRDRGTYEARKLVFNVSKDARIPAYLLVPKGNGPFPAVLALHDHGAFFAIGREKVIRPFEESAERIQTAQQWVERCYGGRFIGDELARRGYVVLAIDALYWGDRGRKEGVDYNAQQALAGNLLQMGMTWLGVITWDDIRSAEFLASLPEVDPQRIGTVGLSMGSHRAWMLSAASDRIAAGMAICWMGTTPSLVARGNNQMKGYSAYAMLAPDLRNYLDYPDVAAIACPKPMLFYNGEQDGLFPVDGVNDAYALMHRVWQSQGADEKLVTRMWHKPHVFDVEMQDAAFAWLDAQLKQP